MKFEFCGLSFGGRPSPRRTRIAVVVGCILLLCLPWLRGSPAGLEDPKAKREIVAMFEHAYSGYESYAWGQDELLPLSKRGTTRFKLCATMVDALDTMWLMGLHRRFDAAVAHIQKSFTSDLNHEESLFETTIRILGGLISAHSLSGRKVLLDHAVDLGRRLLKAFDGAGRAGIPSPALNLHTGAGRGTSCLSEPTTLQLEFRQLSKLSGLPQLTTQVDKVMDTIERLQPETLDGLLPLQPAWLGGGQSGRIGFGARGDSYYEYLLKQAIQLPQDKRYRQMYNTAVGGMQKHLLKTTAGGTLYLAELELQRNGEHQPVHKMDHLVCFVPGMLALGVHLGIDEHPESLRIAEQLMRTCHRMYSQSATGLAPEIAQFDPDGVSPADLWVKPADSFSRLRPETVESLFILWRVTHNPQYREWGIQIARAIEKHAKVASGGYAVVKNVNLLPVVLEDKMESFLLAETFKYLFLLFSDDSVLPLREYVFNTEAHPFPVPL